MIRRSRARVPDAATIGGDWCSAAESGAALIPSGTFVSSVRSGAPANEMNEHEYEIMFRREERYFWYRGMRRIARRLAPELFSRCAGRVLDAGTGTGANLAHVLERWGAG